MELQTYFGWLDGQVISNLPPIPESEPHDPAWRAPSYVSLPAEWESTGPIEAIRFAGANHLCVELDYRPEAGSPGVRRVEPYALRRSRPGHLLLYARNVQRARVSAYRIDRIRRARITPEPFLPRWRVEF
jgi:predicted DNA-binding transcriptional regulator YafY